jgi:hypothetical protein
MKPSRKLSREAWEKTLQYRSHQERLLIDELLDEKLNQLQVFIGQLKRTPHGRAELQRRSRSFGTCQRMEGESAGEFYGRLRHWLDRDLAPLKSPRNGSRPPVD